MATFNIPANWSEILNGVQHALAQASQLAQERESAQASSDPGRGRSSDLAEQLHSYVERLARLEDQERAAMHDLSEIDGALAEAECQLRAYLALVDSVGSRLAQWPARAIG